MTEWPTRKRPPTPGALPTTTIWARSSSTPDEHDATLENSARSCPIASAAGVSISPSATAMPSAVVPLERFIDSSGSSVTVSSPRPRASSMVAIVSSGVLVWT